MKKTKKEGYSEPLLTEHGALLDITAQTGSVKDKDTEEKTENDDKDVLSDKRLVEDQDPV